MPQKGTPHNPKRPTDPVYPKPIKEIGTKFILKIECVDCAGWYAESKKVCPFCGTVNLEQVHNTFSMSRKRNTEL